MNKQGPNGIEWTDFTWNPVTGCLHGCEYCYAAAMARRFKKSFEPMFWPHRLAEVKQPKAGDTVFVCSNADLFGDWVQRDVIEEVIAATRTRPDVTFQFLTKNPKRYAEFNPWPANCWLGATATTWHDAENIHRTLQYLQPRGQGVTFLSLEPLQNEWPDEEYVGVNGFDWVIVGAMTGPMAKKDDWRLSEQTISKVVQCCDYYETPVFMKSNLRPYWSGELRQEWPREVTNG